VVSGTYVLRRANGQPHLAQRLPEIANFELEGKIVTLADVERLLTSRRSPTP
jgi:hypothetical protein